MPLPGVLTVFIGTQGSEGAGRCLVTGRGLRGVVRLKPIADPIRSWRSLFLGVWSFDPVPTMVSAFNPPGQVMGLNLSTVKTAGTVMAPYHENDRS